jgi:hypothetical protein
MGNASSNGCFIDVGPVIKIDSMQLQTLHQGWMEVINQQPLFHGH